MKQLKLLLSISAVAAFLFAGKAWAAATNYVSPVQTYACATHTWANSLTGSTAATACTQPAVGDLANVAAGTMLGNATGSSAAPTATATPVLGVASTTAGTLGLYSSASANAITIKNLGATSAYNFNLPLTPGSAGQVLTSQAGGSSAMTWTTMGNSIFTIASKTTAYNVVTLTDDGTRFDNTGASGSVIMTLPSAPAAGDNYCFLVTAAQTFEVLANTGQTITMGNITGASAGNLQSGTVGSSVCVYYESTTTIYAWASSGQWQLN